MEYENIMYMSSSNNRSGSNEMPLGHSTTSGGAAAAAAGVSSKELLTPTDQYAAYADNFDLSLLPVQDAGIPTTVYQYNEQPQGPPPQIKIENAWDHFISAATHIKQEPEHFYNHHLYAPISGNQLIPPPPAYPHSAYPSPQSSPLQSEFASFGFGGKYDSLSSSRSSLYGASSPCPSLDANCIKQELHILPPSPPESNCETPSPRSACSESIKAEPLDTDVESFVDLNTLLQQPDTAKIDQDHHVLNDQTKRNNNNNLKPLALESFIGGLAEVRGDFEPVISLALEHVKREADAVCAELQISQDPNAWNVHQVHAWLRSTLMQFKLPPVAELEMHFNEDGAALILLTEEEFIRRLPESGSTLHAQLEIWKMAYADSSYQCGGNQMEVQSTHQQPQPSITTTTNTASTTITEMWPTNYEAQRLEQEQTQNEDSEDDEELPQQAASVVASVATNTTQSSTKRSGNGRSGGGSHIHLWQFLKELLGAPQVNGTAIRWIDRSKGIFKIEDSVRVAKLWGRRKNRPAMNYDKLSRSIRQYYKKGIMKKTERSQRLVYQFCQPYHQ